MTASLMRGKDSADAILYKRPPGAVDYGAQAQRKQPPRKSTAGTSSMFGDAQGATINLDDDEGPSEAELDRRAQRAERFANDLRVSGPGLFPSAFRFFLPKIVPREHNSRRSSGSLYPESAVPSPTPVVRYDCAR